MPQFNFPKEIILDSCKVYYRLHEMWFRKGKLSPSVFKDREGSMSVDWGKYSTPEQSQARAKNPARNKIGILSVEGIRSIQSLKVEHSPDNETGNQAHTDVLGEKTNKVQLKLYNICKNSIRSFD